MIRVVVVEDETLVRDGLVAIVSAADDLEVVGSAANGEEALRCVASTSPDVVLMDLRMPVLDGIDATTRLVARGDAARVLVLTTVETDEAVLDAFRAGASGFVLKSSPRVELWHAPSARSPTAARCWRPPSRAASSSSGFVPPAVRRGVSST